MSITFNLTEVARNSIPENNINEISQLDYAPSPKKSDSSPK